MALEDVLMSEIRTIRLVIDLEDIYNPEVLLEDYLEENRTEPEPPRYRVVTLEVLTCPQDGQPVSISECGKCRRFIRRLDNKLYCRGGVFARGREKR
ncbi:MAG: hypothetical protein QXF26_05300 [Candidatus Bathyarchaeia archaeon]